MIVGRRKFLSCYYSANPWGSGGEVIGLGVVPIRTSLYYYIVNARKPEPSSL
jgi:hypothetical protein